MILSAKELLLFHYFTRNDRFITADEILIKLRREGDRDFILNLICSLEEQFLIKEVPNANAWRLSDYGKYINGNKVQNLMKI